MKIEMALVREETYTFTPNDGDEPVHIFSGQLRQWLLEKAMDKVIELTFPDQTLDEIILQHGLEEPRMQSMTEVEASEPVIVGLWPGGTHVLIDGGHRRWYWAKRGVNVIRGWAVPYEIWSQYQFDPATLVAYHRQDGAELPQRKGSG